MVRRLKWVDSARGVAVLLVVLMHVTIVAYTPFTLDDASRVTWQAMVDMVRRDEDSTNLVDVRVDLRAVAGDLHGAHRHRSERLDAQSLDTEEGRSPPIHRAHHGVVATAGSRPVDSRDWGREPGEAHDHVALDRGGVD